MRHHVSRPVRALGWGLLALVLGTLLCFQWEFPPLTVEGMCREVGRSQLMTAPEPVFVRRERIGWSAEDSDAFVVGKSGGSWVSFQYRRERPFGLWRLSPRVPLQVSEEPHAATYGGDLYLVGVEGEPVSVRCDFTLQETVIRLLEGDERSQPELGPSRDFAFAGTREAEGVWSFHYHDETVFTWDLPDDQKQPGELASQWYRLERDGEDHGYGVLHVDIPVRFTLEYQDGRQEELTIPVENYQLHYY